MAKKIISLENYLKKHEDSASVKIENALKPIKKEIESAIGMHLEKRIILKYIKENQIKVSSRQFNSYIKKNFPDKYLEYVADNSVNIYIKDNNVENVFKIASDLDINMFSEKLLKFLFNSIVVEMSCSRDYALKYNYKHTTLVNRILDKSKINETVILKLSFIINLVVFTYDSVYLKHKLSSFKDESQVVNYSYYDKSNSKDVLRLYDDVIIECLHDVYNFLTNSEDIEATLLYENINKKVSTVNKIFNKKVFADYVL